MELVEIHVFSGNDYISSFSKKVKEKMLEDCWEISKKFNLLQNVVYQRRTTWRHLSPARRVKNMEEIWSKASVRT